MQCDDVNDHGQNIPCQPKILFHLYKTVICNEIRQKMAMMLQIKINT